MLWDEPKIFFLERRYFFSIILSEFLKNRVALQDDWEETFLRSIAKLKDSDYADMMRTVYSKLTPYEGGSCILTDDKAPVEVLGMRVLDELIGDELNYYKDELRTGGLSALIGN